MKTSIADRIALASILMTACLTVGGWGYAWRVQQDTGRLMHTTYAHPTESFSPALAADPTGPADAESIANRK